MCCARVVSRYPVAVYTRLTRLTPRSFYDRAGQENTLLPATLSTYENIPFAAWSADAPESTPEGSSRRRLALCPGRRDRRLGLGHSGLPLRRLRPPRPRQLPAAQRVREERTSAATCAESEPAAPAKTPLLSLGHRHRRITPSHAQQPVDRPRNTLAKLKPAQPAPRTWRSTRAACVYGRARGCTARARAWPPSPACLTPSGARSRCPLSRAAGAWRPAATPPAPRAESVIRCAAARGWVAWALGGPFPGP